MKLCNSRGFTLVELLVVISIVTLLIAILLPALGKARSTALVMQCGSIERQINIAIFNYVTDNDNFMPYAAWRASLVIGGYMPGVAKQNDPTASLNFRCPIDEAIRPSADRYAVRTSYSGSIGWSPTTDPAWVPQATWFARGLFPAHGQAPRIRLDDTAEPSATLTLCEFWGPPSEGRYSNYLRFNAGAWQDSSARTRGWSAFSPNSVVHDGRANFAFADGHVTFMPWTDTWRVGVANKGATQGTGDRDLWNRK